LFKGLVKGLIAIIYRPPSLQVDFWALHVGVLEEMDYRHKPTLKLTLESHSSMKGMEVSFGPLVSSPPCTVLSGTGSKLASDFQNADLCREGRGFNWFDRLSVTFY
jgi:hypothetical protein